MDAGADGPGSTDALVETGMVCDSSTAIMCGGECVDRTMPAHCGTCTNICPGPEAGEGHATCSNGVCGVACDQDSSTSLDCNGACVSPTDPAHCGSCTMACPPPKSGNGSPSCPAPMTCGVNCSNNYHMCGSDCLSDSDLPSDTTDPCIVSDAFGVFVSPGGMDSNAGTMASPVATIGHAMDLAKSAHKRVYACGGSYTTGDLVVGSSRDGVALYAGLDCSMTPWVYNASKVATIAPATAGYALQMTGLTAGVTFEDFVFQSKDGSSAGASSIAVFASGSMGIVLRRCTVQAGSGTQGQDQTQQPTLSAAPSGNPGMLTSAGAQQPNPLCPTSIGGAGGPPGPTPGNDGSDGQPGTSNKGVASAQDCGAGSSGKNGAAGGPGGSGPGASAWATFGASGWSPTAGQPGGGGTVGQGLSLIHI